MTEWYYATDGEKHGPVSTPQLKQLAATGELRPEDKIWREGLDGWAKASEAKGLFTDSEPSLSFPRNSSPHVASALTDESSKGSCNKRAIMLVLRIIVLCTLAVICIAIPVKGKGDIFMKEMKETVVIFAMIALVATVIGIYTFLKWLWKHKHNVDLMHDENLAVQKHYAKAFKWARKAAEQGNAEAQCSLGSMYADGDGVQQDDAQAVKWYRKSAEQGNALARNELEGRGLSWEPDRILTSHRSR